MEVRPARPDDLPTVLAVTGAARQRRSAWSPRFFAPREGADALREAYLAYLVQSDDHDTQVLVDDGGAVVGFLVLVPQAGHTWVDDLEVVDHGWWPMAARTVADRVPVPWVTCVVRADTRRAKALRAAGAEVASTYWARSLQDHPIPKDGRAAAVVDAPRPGALPPAARHTFGPGPVDPAAPGALVVADDQHGIAVGSPGIEPPLYDPGGPTCVIDRLGGPDRGGLLDRVLDAVAARGDAAMTVVADTADPQLADLLAGHGFRPEVDLLGVGLDD